MYAVIQSGGKQYRVAEGQTVKLEKLASEPGEKITIEPVLMVHGGEENITIGAPYVESAKVQAEVIGHGRHKKIKILKFKRRKHQMKRMGHRQDYTEVKITKVEL